MKKNISASVRQRLLNYAKTNHKPFAEVLQMYGMERFLYRLAESVHAKSYILKGAMMLRAWDLPDSRPTMDIDMLGVTNNEIENIISQIKVMLLTNEV